MQLLVLTFCYYHATFAAVPVLWYRAERLAIVAHTRMTRHPTALPHTRLTRQRDMAFTLAQHSFRHTPYHAARQRWPAALRPRIHSRPSARYGRGERYLLTYLHIWDHLFLIVQRYSPHPVWTYGLDSVIRIPASLVRVVGSFAWTTFGSVRLDLRSTVLVVCGVTALLLV